MSNIARMMQRATAGAAGAGLDIPEVFSTYLYDGNASTQTITNGIDLSGEGGLVWIKQRDDTNPHVLFDTERGTLNTLHSNQTSLAEDESNSLTSYNSNGFTLGNFAQTNGTSTNGLYTSWTFRKAPKFFDVVTYTGNGSFSQTINHNLGCEVGAILIKRTDTSSNWVTAMRLSSGTYAEMYLNTTGSNLGNFSPSASNTSFVVGGNWAADSSYALNASGGTYVAYLFAHNNSDGEFGPDADQDIIKCGSYTGNGSSTGPSINLGFEPQWVLIKLASGSGENWILMDNMRGMPVGSNDTLFEINNSGAEKSTSEILNLTATGFDIKSTSNGINTNNQTYIYIAIRRGPLAEPESATDVFQIKLRSGTSADASIENNITTDVVYLKPRNQADEWVLYDRLRGSGLYLYTHTADNEQGSINAGDGLKFNKQQTGYEVGNLSRINATGTNYVDYAWKRAPGYFDVVAYTGNNTAGHAVPHNLGVTPEMVWVKERNDTIKWYVFMPGILGTTSALTLNDTNATITVDSFTAYNETNLYFSGDGDVNGTSPYIAYLFATLAGVSKVGSFQGTGGTVNVDCGFSSGARFVLFKDIGTASNWFVFDTERGIVSGTEPRLLLNTTAAEVNTDTIDPYSLGFSINNTSGNTYIFYAIA